MARIVISVSELEEFLDDNLDISVSDFQWRDGNTKPSIVVDYTVTEDLEYDDPNYVTLEEYNKLQQKLDELMATQPKKKWWQFK